MQYSDEIRFIGISGQDDIEAMEQFVDEFDLGGFEHIADKESSIWRAFQVNAQPSFVFINDNGHLRRHIGGLEFEQLTDELDSLIAT